MSRDNAARSIANKAKQQAKLADADKAYLNSKIQELSDKIEELYKRVKTLEQQLETI